MGVCPGSVRLPYLLRLVEIGHNSRIGIGPVQFLLDEEFPDPGRYHRGEHVDELRSDDAPVSLGPHGGQGDYVLVEPEEGLDLPSSVVHEVDVPGIEVLIRNEADGSESGLLLSVRLAVIGFLLLRIGEIAPAFVGGIEAAPVAVVIKAVLALLGGLNHVAPVPEGFREGEKGELSDPGIGPFQRRDVADVPLLQGKEVLGGKKSLVAHDGAFLKVGSVDEIRERGHIQHVSRIYLVTQRLLLPEAEGVENRDLLGAFRPRLPRPLH